jgi:hypothetical protein
MELHDLEPFLAALAVTHKLLVVPELLTNTSERCQLHTATTAAPAAAATSVDDGLNNLLVSSDMHECTTLLGELLTLLATAWSHGKTRLTPPGDAPPASWTAFDLVTKAIEEEPLITTSARAHLEARAKGTQAQS